jgi:Alpha/beta hydrolase family
MGIAVFVHGTGVRADGFSLAFQQIRNRLVETVDGLDVKPCYWGGSEGAELNGGGASIPSYDNTGGEDPSEKDEELALWSILYIDPWYELRLLGDWPTDREEMAPGEEPPSSVLVNQIQNFRPSDGLVEVLRRNGLDACFGVALAALREASEFSRTADKVNEANLNEVRKAIARALTAKISSLGEEGGLPPFDGGNRDQLVSRITDELHGYGMGLAAWLTRPFKGVASHMTTRLLGRKRGAVSDSTTPAAGDIMRYQARGAGIRDVIRQVIADSTHAQPGKSVVLIGHSLGGIACVEALIEGSVVGVDRLVTVGSQAPFFYEIDALATLRYGQPLPADFPAWLNIYDPRDFLSYVGAPVFPGRVEDRQVDNGQPFPQSHSAYWKNDETWRSIGDFLT